VSRIKTRDAVRNIKTLDRAADISRRMRQAAFCIKEKAADTVHDNADSSDEYALDKMQNSAKDLGKESVHRLAKTVKKAIHSPGKTAQKARAVAESVKKTGKAIVKTSAAAIKAVAKGAKSLAAVIASGGATAVIVVVMIMLIGLIVGSSYGIFLSSEGKIDSSSKMCNVVRQLEQEYKDKIEEIKDSTSYDDLHLSGGHPAWQGILSVYAVKAVSDDSGLDVATINDVKKNLLRQVFWDMTTIEHETECVIGESGDDENTIVSLTITVSGKSADEAAAEYGFDDDQMAQLHELTNPEYLPLWMSVIYGIDPGSDIPEIVTVALSQIGNIGGEPYWSWYGFHSHVDWCACFVSWCANECGYIENGSFLKFASCSAGAAWFKSHGQWLDGGEMPEPGMIIFFDWDNRGSSGPQDGIADHVGIVERIEDGVIYTVEGNSADGCWERQYAAGGYEILGFGI